LALVVDDVGVAVGVAVAFVWVGVGVGVAVGVGAGTLALTATLALPCLLVTAIVPVVEPGVVVVTVTVSFCDACFFSENEAGETEKPAPALTVPFNVPPFTFVMVNVPVVPVVPKDRLVGLTPNFGAAKAGVAAMTAAPTKRAPTAAAI